MDQDSPISKEQDLYQQAHQFMIEINSLPLETKLKEAFDGTLTYTAKENLLLSLRL